MGGDRLAHDSAAARAMRFANITIWKDSATLQAALLHFAGCRFSRYENGKCGRRAGLSRCPPAFDRCPDATCRQYEFGPRECCACPTRRSSPHQTPSITLSHTASRRPVAGCIGFSDRKPRGLAHSRRRTTLSISSSDRHRELPKTRIHDRSRRGFSTRSATPVATPVKSDSRANSVATAPPFLQARRSLAAPTQGDPLPTISLGPHEPQDQLRLDSIPCNGRRR